MEVKAPKSAPAKVQGKGENFGMTFVLVLHLPKSFAIRIMHTSNTLAR